MALRDEAIVGVALAHEANERGTAVEAAMVGSIEADLPGAPITAALLASLLERGHDLEVEADEGERAHPELLHVLRQIASTTWRPPTMILGRG